MLVMLLLLLSMSHFWPLSGVRGRPWRNDYPPRRGEEQVESVGEEWGRGTGYTRGEVVYEDPISKDEASSSNSNPSAEETIELCCGGGKYGTGMLYRKSRWKEGTKTSCHPIMTIPSMHTHTSQIPSPPQAFLALPPFLPLDRSRTLKSEETWARRPLPSAFSTLSLKAAR